MARSAHIALEDLVKGGVLRQEGEGGGVLQTSVSAYALAVLLGGKRSGCSAEAPLRAGQATGEKGNGEREGRRGLYCGPKAQRATTAVRAKQTAHDDGNGATPAVT
eukprot:CAMPEP_0176309466 /NCGR_PEP_ID=MMETSP0121_2-20121125/65094_1 /TAXON_ID=160619 /ORGANISM="Kryptoperidinium foliaceum, Strain CCMP 1326" /LENGTH=105 /DNA_ID=CAMNT_0017651371 /DNA_START=417 /DNA_END=730 /DNA_ORIENTATION=-